MILTARCVGIVVTTGVASFPGRKCELGIVPEPSHLYHEAQNTGRAEHYTIKYGGIQHTSCAASYAEVLIIFPPTRVHVRLLGHASQLLSLTTALIVRCYVCIADE